MVKYLLQDDFISDMNFSISPLTWLIDRPPPPHWFYSKHFQQISSLTWKHSSNEQHTSITDKKVIGSRHT